MASFHGGGGRPSYRWVSLKFALIGGAFENDTAMPKIENAGAELSTVGVAAFFAWVIDVKPALINLKC